MKRIVKTTASIGITEILLIGIAFARNKYLAVTIGPEGFGIYGLIRSFFMMIAVFSSSWMVSGTTKYIAEYNSKKDYTNLHKIFSFSSVVSLLSAVFLFLLLIINKDFFINRFLSKDVKSEYYFIFSIAFIALNIRPILLAVLQGTHQVKEVVLSRWGIAIVNLLLVFLLTYFYQLKGFFLSIVFTEFWAILILFYVTLKNPVIQFHTFTFREPAIQKLLSFGSVALLLSLFNLGSQYAQKFIVIRYLDVEWLGIFHAALSFMAYLGIARRGAAFYFSPRMGESLGPDERIREINQYIRFILMINIPLCVVAILYGEFAIKLMFSSSFLALTSVFHWFVIAQLLSMVGSGFQLAVVGMAKLKIHSISSIVTNILWFVLPLILIKSYGLGAVGMGLIAGSFIGLVINFLYLHK